MTVPRPQRGLRGLPKENVEDDGATATAGLTWTSVKGRRKDDGVMATAGLTWTSVRRGRRKSMPEKALTDVTVVIPFCNTLSSQGQRSSFRFVTVNRVKGNEVRSVL